MTETPAQPTSQERESEPTLPHRVFDLSHLAAAVLDEATVPETVETVLNSARAAVDCRDAAVVFVHGKQRLELVAGTNPAIAALVDKQMEVRRGPVLSMVKDGHSVTVRDTREETRWPGWASAAAALGYRSFIGVRISTSEQTIGTLNLYDSRPEHFSTADVQVARVLARHAAVALSRIRESDNLWRAVDARKLIGQAQGVLMERYDLDEDRSFEVLRRYSQDRNVKLRDVAQMIVNTRRLPE